MTPPPLNVPKTKKKMHWLFKTVLWLVGIFIVIGIVAVATGDDNKNEPNETSNSSTVKPTRPAITVTARQLHKDYSDNEVAADNKYKGKDLEITGMINTISKDILKDAYVTLRANEYDEVQCYFENESELESLRKGQQITVIGVGDGLAIINPIIRECKLK